MEEIFYIFAKSVEIFLSLIYFALLVRMLFPIFTPEPEGNAFYRLAFAVSEVVVAPARLILGVFNIGQNSPLDFSLLGGYLLLLIIQLFLPVLS